MDIWDKHSTQLFEEVTLIQNFWRSEFPIESLMNPQTHASELYIDLRNVTANLIETVDPLTLNILCA